MQHNTHTKSVATQHEYICAKHEVKKMKVNENKLVWCGRGYVTNK